MRPNPTWHSNATGKRWLKPKTKRSLAFLIFVLIALPVIRALIPAQPHGRHPILRIDCCIGSGTARQPSLAIS
jgi:hypothetical protein